jgi:hypothetical protein
MVFVFEQADLPSPRLSVCAIYFISISYIMNHSKQLSQTYTFCNNFVLHSEIHFNKNGIEYLRHIVEKWVETTTSSVGLTDRKMAAEASFCQPLGWSWTVAASHKKAVAIGKKRLTFLYARLVRSARSLTISVG